MRGPRAKAFRDAFCDPARVGPVGCAGSPLLAAYVYADLIRAGHATSLGVRDLADQLCSPSSRAREEAAVVTGLVVAGDVGRLAELVERVVLRRGWGRSLRRAMGSAISSIPVRRGEEILDDVLVVVGGEAWTYRRVIRRAHPHSNNPVRVAFYRRAMGPA